MQWRPPLQFRWSKGGASPTTTFGYVCQCLAAVTFGTTCVLAAAVAEKTVALFGLVPVGLLLRDSLAWFVASEPERQAFVQEAEIFREIMAQSARSSVPSSKLFWWGLVGVAGLALTLLIAQHPTGLMVLLFAIAMLGAAFSHWIHRRNRTRAGPPTP